VRPVRQSTLAQALADAPALGLARCCQDELGDRRRVEAAVRARLADGASAVVDRTNFDAQQRAHWTRIAREFGAQAWMLVLDAPHAVCHCLYETVDMALIDRRSSVHNACVTVGRAFLAAYTLSDAQSTVAGTGHPTLTNPELALSVLGRFMSDYRAPAPDEGYDRLLHVSPAELPPLPYTPDTLAALIARVGAEGTPGDPAAPVTRDGTAGAGPASASSARGWDRGSWRNGAARGYRGGYGEAPGDHRGGGPGYRGGYRGHENSRGGASGYRGGYRGSSRGSYDGGSRGGYSNGTRGGYNNGARSSYGVSDRAAGPYERAGRSHEARELGADWRNRDNNRGQEDRNAAGRGAWGDPAPTERNAPSG
jgi:hypothetical protein